MSVTNPDSPLLFVGFRQRSALIRKYSEDAIALPAIDARHVACTSEEPEKIRRNVFADCRKDTQRRCWRLRFYRHLGERRGVLPCIAIEQSHALRVAIFQRIRSIASTTLEVRNNSNDRLGV